MNTVSSSVLLETSDLWKSYWRGGLETPVLKGVGLKISEGERAVIMGPSGAGKSTLLHVLGSLDPPEKGRVLFRGENLYAQEDRSLSLFRNREIGFVFQFHHLIPELSAIENVMVPLLIRGLPRAEAREKAGNVLERLGLLTRAAHRPAELSGGEEQRVAIARAVVGEPRILFADEPTGNLDWEGGKRLMELLFELVRERGMTLVMVTHNEALAEQFPRKFFLKDGQLVDRS